MFFIFRAFHGARPVQSARREWDKVPPGIMELEREHILHRPAYRCRLLIRRLRRNCQHDGGCREGHRVFRRHILRELQQVQGSGVPHGGRVVRRALSPGFRVRGVRPECAPGRNGGDTYQPPVCHYWYVEFHLIGDVLNDHRQETGIPIFSPWWHRTTTWHAPPQRLHRSSTSDHACA